MKLEDELKTKNFTSSSQKAILNIMFTGNWLSNRFENVLKPFGISLQQYNVLRILKGRKGETANLQDITDRMMDKMSNATRLVEKLRIKGLVTREICPANRRKVEIEITKKGLELLSEIEPVVIKENHDIIKTLGETNSNLINELLDEIRSNNK